MQAQDSIRLIQFTSVPQCKSIKRLFVFSNVLLIFIFSSSCSFGQSLKLEIKELNATELKTFSDEIDTGLEYNNDFVCWAAMGQALSMAHHYEYRTLRLSAFRGKNSLLQIHPLPCLRRQEDRINYLHVFNTLFSIHRNHGLFTF